MRTRAGAAACCVVLALCATALGASSLSTVQNSTLSVPTANIAARGVPGASNLLGSNFLMSALSPTTQQGGRGWLVNSQSWVRRYAVGSPSVRSTASGMVIRPDGNVVITGYTSGPATVCDFLTVCYAADGTPLWTNLYDGPVHGEDIAYYVAAGMDGEAWVAGTSARSATNSQWLDAVLIKYASNGAPLWTNRYISAATNADYPAALAIDSSGNAYLLAYSVYWPPPGYSGSPLGDSIIKYDSLGVPLWTNLYSADTTQGLTDPYSMALDGAGNLFVAGDAVESYDGGSALVKLATDGTAVWTNYHSFPFMSPVRSVVVDSRGDAVLTGESFSNSLVDYVTLKVSASGGSLWTNTVVGPAYDGGDVPQTLLDPVGNVFLVGGSPGVQSLGLYQILKFSSNGVPLWTNLTATFITNDSAIVSAAVDNAGNLYLAGFSPESFRGNPDFVTVKYSGQGVALWTNLFDGGAGTADLPSALAVDDAGNVYVAGQSQDLVGSELTLVKYADVMFYSPPRDFTGSDAITYSVADNLGNQATGSVSVVVTPGAFRLSVSSTNFNSAGFQLRLDGAPGTNAAVIETSPDLVHWQPLLTNATVNGSVQLRDSSATNFPHRFYRAIQQQ